MEFKAFPAWMYHKTENPKIVHSEDEKQKHYDEGWRDSPAPFINIKDFNVDPDDSSAIQQLGDAVQGVADSLNGALQLENMDKEGLEEYAKEHYGKDIDRRKSTKKLRAEVQAMIDGNG